MPLQPPLAPLRTGLAALLPPLRGIPAAFAGLSAGGWAAVAVLAGVPSTAPAQSVPPAEPTARSSVVRAAEITYFGGDPGGAVDRLDALLDERPGLYGALWRAAWFSLTEGLLRDSSEARTRWFERGAEYGRRAEEVRPDRIEGRYWRTANLGLRALETESIRRMARLGDEVHERSWALIEEDSLHAGAHNVLGRTYFETMRVSGFVRFMGRVFVRGELLSEASWENARRHLERAVELEPDVIYYRLDLIRLLTERERYGELVRHACDVRDLPPVHPPDAKLKEEARALLGEAMRETEGREGEPCGG